MNGVSLISFLGFFLHMALVNCILPAECNVEYLRGLLQE